MQCWIQSFIYWCAHSWKSPSPRFLPRDTVGSSIKYDQMISTHFQLYFSLSCFCVTILLANRNLYNCNYTPHYQRTSSEYWSKSQKNKSSMQSTKCEVLITTASNNELNGIELTLIVVGCKSSQIIEGVQREHVHFFFSRGVFIDKKWQAI